MRSTGARRDAMDELVALLRTSTADGWELVEQTQRAVHRRFRSYSCLSWWETPRAAFARGRGYCVQYNGALAAVLRALGVDSRLMCTARVALRDDPTWRMGHVWVEVRLGGQVRAVCAGRAANRPGDVGFSPVTTVRPFGRVPRLLTTLAMGPIVGWTLLAAALRRQSPPTWLFRPMD